PPPPYSPHQLYHRLFRAPSVIIGITPDEIAPATEADYYGLKTAHFARQPSVSRHQSDTYMSFRLKGLIDGEKDDEDEDPLSLPPSPPPLLLFFDRSRPVGFRLSVGLPRGGRVPLPYRFPLATVRTVRTVRTVQTV